MRNLYFFLLGLLISTALFIPYRAHAAVSLTPVVSGYSASAGRFASAAGSFTMTAANDGYIAQSVVNVAGKAVTLPATLRMAANAGQFALAGMRLNPWLLAGTLALPWLIDHGLQVQDGVIVKNGSSWAWPVDVGCVAFPHFNGYAACSNIGNADTDFTSLSPVCSSAGGGLANDEGAAVCVWGSSNYPVPSYVPATQADFDALPDPLPAIAPELPFAPYLPEGVPVNQPEFAPSDVPLGNPYTKPDGSTAQPRAKISPSGDGQVTVSTYDQPLTDSQGQPVANPTPQPTPDQAPTDCDKKPDSVGCTDLGTPPLGEDMPHAEQPITFTPVSISANATCPAPITVNGFGQTLTIDYSSACTYASGLRPIVIAIGYLTALFIIFGVPRSAQS